MFNIEQVAQMCHENNRLIQTAANENNVSPAWFDAPEWQRSSARAGVVAVLNGDTPEQLHESWCEHKRASRWVFGHEKNEATRTHPCLVPYNYLSREQKAKDEVFHALVNALRPFIETEYKP